jgi:hypothetical protein
VLDCSKWGSRNKRKWEGTAINRPFPTVVYAHRWSTSEDRIDYGDVDSQAKNASYSKILFTPNPVNHNHMQSSYTFPLTRYEIRAKLIIGHGYHELEGARWTSQVWKIAPNWIKF